MDKLKPIFIGLGLIFAAILLYVAVTFVVSVFWYLIVFGVVALGGYGAYKFINRPQRTLQLEPGSPEHELAKAQKTIDDYRSKLASGKE